MIERAHDDGTLDLMRMKGGVETNAEHIADGLRRTRPWTTEQLEVVRDKALALVRTRRSVDLPGSAVLTAFDGHALWELLSALDRTDMR